MSRPFAVGDRVLVLESYPSSECDGIGQVLTVLSIDPWGYVKLSAPWRTDDRYIWSEPEHLRHADEPAPGAWVDMPALPPKPMLCEVSWPELSQGSSFSLFNGKFFCETGSEEFAAVSTFQTGCDITRWRPAEQPAQAKPAQGPLHAALHGVTEADHAGIDKLAASDQQASTATDDQPADAPAPPRSAAGLLTMAPYSTKQPHWGTAP